MIGIYGVMSYLIAQRTRELGIRLALGASPQAVLGLVFRTGMKLVLVGLAIGSGAAVLLSQSLKSQLFGVSTLDVSSLAAVGLLAIITLLACLVPALRAIRIDPNDALRTE